LQAACKAVLSFPLTLVFAVLFVAIQIAYILLWCVATYGSLHHDEYRDDKKNYTKAQQFGIVSGLVLILYWTSFIIRNIITVTTAGSVTSWWLQSSTLGTTSSLSRALTLSFGSICFGSLIVSILELINSILSTIMHAANSSGNATLVSLLCCVRCCVTCVEKIVQYFNRYAYTYVGIYGYSFLTAGKHVFELFSSKGWSTIANDSLTETVLMMGSVLVGCGCSTSGWAVVEYGKPEWFVGVEHPKRVLGFTGFLLGFFICHVLMSVISSAVATVFVLFAEDSESLQLTHPSDHEQLHRAWAEVYPDEYSKMKSNSFAAKSSAV